MLKPIILVANLTNIKRRNVALTTLARSVSFNNQVINLIILRSLLTTEGIFPSQNPILRKEPILLRNPLAIFVLSLATGLISVLCEEKPNINKKSLNFFNLHMILLNGIC
jgi:hypothetical protein